MTRISQIIARSRSVAGTVALTASLAALAAVPAVSLAGSSPAPAAAPADGLHHYRVTITNLTHGQPLSPPVLVTNYGSGEIFKPGGVANWGVQQVAENGNTDPLYAGLKADQDAGYVTGLVRAAGPLVPAGVPASAMFGKSVTLTIAAKQGQRISWISMLGCTNDGFVGFNAAKLPKAPGRTVNVPVRDFDAGTEENTEDFADLTAGCQAAIGVHSTFGATGTNQTDWSLAEGGTIQQHEGVQDVSDDGLRSEVHGWVRNKAAKATITQLD
jgi:hypothetical protein